MPKNLGKGTKQAQWSRFHGKVKGEIPTVVGWFDDRDDFRELRLKARDDGTILAVAKGYDSNGGMVVSFGVGYDVVTSLMALDGVIQSGAWRVDKPWPANGKGE